MAAADVTCSFLWTQQKDVDLMISGIHAHICDKCVIQSQSDFKWRKRKAKPKGQPAQLQTDQVQRKSKVLDEYVIGQDQAKKVLSVAVYNHYKAFDAAQNCWRWCSDWKNQTSLWLAKLEPAKHILRERFRQNPSSSHSVLLTPPYLPRPVTLAKMLKSILIHVYYKRRLQYRSCRAGIVLMK